MKYVVNKDNIDLKVHQSSKQFFYIVHLYSQVVKQEPEII